MGRRRIDTEIALLAGRDLDEVSEVDVERRVRLCPISRQRRDEMQDCLEVLHACRERLDASHAEAANEGESVWPAVASRLPVRQPSGALDQLRPWVPAITVAGLVLALATVMTNRPVERRGEAAQPILVDWGPLDTRMSVPAVAPGLEIDPEWEGRDFFGANGVAFPEMNGDARPITEETESDGSVTLDQFDSLFGVEIH